MRTGRLWLVLVVALGLVGSGLPIQSASVLAAEPPSEGPPVETGPPSGRLGPPEAAKLSYTPTSRRWDNGDGTSTVELYSGPAFFQDRSGSWRAMDPSLVADDAAVGRLRTRSLPEVAPTLTQRASADRPLLSVGPAGDRLQVSYPALQGRPAAEIVGEGRSVVYAQALPGGWDLRVTSQTTGYKEQVTVPSAAARDAGSPDGYQVVFGLPEGWKAEQIDEGVEFTDGQGSPVGLYSHGVAWDADHESTPVTVTLAAGSGSGVTVDVGVDPSWLADAARTFPVTIDPTFTHYMTKSTDMTHSSYECDGSPYFACDTWVYESWPTKTYWNWDQVVVGEHSIHLENTRTFLQFETDWLGEETTTRYPVTSAELVMDVSYLPSSGGSDWYRVDALGSEPSRSTTWNYQPWIDTGISPSYLYAGGTGLYRFDVTNWAKAWMNGTKKQHGLRVKAYYDNDTTGPPPCDRTSRLTGCPHGTREEEANETQVLRRVQARRGRAGARDRPVDRRGRRRAGVVRLHVGQLGESGRG